MNRLVRDGVALAYTDAGRGEPAVLLVHGAGCDHTSMQPLADHFVRARRVIAVDLRGHGASDRPADGYTMVALADDLAWICNSLGLQRPLVVGHSMGGAVALALAAIHPELPGAIAMLDAPLFLPPQFETAADRLLAALETPAAATAWQQWVRQSFGAFDDPVRRDGILADLARFPPDVLHALLAETFEFDAATAAGACATPALYIRAVTPADTTRFRALCPQLLVGATVAAGHFLQLEVPAQVTAMLERFLAVTPPRSPG